MPSEQPKAAVVAQDAPEDARLASGPDAELAILRSRVDALEADNRALRDLPTRLNSELRRLEQQIADMRGRT